MSFTPAQFPAPGEIRFIRTLPGPIDRVWQYLTILIALLEGAPQPLFWATHTRLKAFYQKLLPAN